MRVVLALLDCIVSTRNMSNFGMEQSDDLNVYTFINCNETFIILSNSIKNTKE